jgi:hypothetical protein
MKNTRTHLCIRLSNIIQALVRPTSYVILNLLNIWYPTSVYTRPVSSQLADLLFHHHSSHDQKAGHAMNPLSGNSSNAARRSRALPQLATTKPGSARDRWADLAATAAVATCADAKESTSALRDPEMTTDYQCPAASASKSVFSRTTNINGR